MNKPHSYPANKRTAINFKFTTYTVAVLSGLAFTGSALSYVQGDTTTATVNVGDNETKIDTVKTDDPKLRITGTLNRSGNPVRIIWYGNPNDADGKVAQTDALNDGFVQGKVIAQGKKAESGEYQASIIIEGQGNAIDALGWSSHTNGNNVDIALNTVTNNRTAMGGADLKAGLASGESEITTFGTANGISVVSIADYGQTQVMGGADGVSGASGTVGSASSSSSYRDDTTRVKTADLVKDTISVPGDTTRADKEGKTVTAEIKKVNNNGSVSGNINAQSNADITSPVTDRYVPQFYSTTTTASGNGVSLASFINTIDSTIQSQNQINSLKLGTLTNTGEINGQGNVTGGKNTTHTYTSARGVANGVSLFAATGNYARNQTSAIFDNENGESAVNNSGKINGHLIQTSGDNVGVIPGSYGNKSGRHLDSTATSFASGNGISVATETLNAYSTNAAKLGKVVNQGNISGYADVKAGNGSGDLKLNVKGSGNGISVYSHKGVGGTALGTASLTSVDNSGMITGELHTKGGKYIYKKDAPDEEVKLFIYDTVKNIDSTDTLPKTPSGSTYSDPFAPNKLGSNDTISEVTASGNGIVVFQASNASGSSQTTGSQLGEIKNSGVVSGYTQMTHGFSATNKGYERVGFWGVGTGIASDGKITSKLENTGIISGNHAALLAKGKIETAYSLYGDYTSGYNNNVYNYGLMAGTMIMGNYKVGENSDVKQQNYTYFELPNDPSLTNQGTLVYLKKGLTKESTYSSTIRNADAETIDKIVVGTGGSYTDSITGKTYNIINGTLSNEQKDSSYTATSDVKDSIINGVGLTDGALIADKNITLDNSVVNGFANGVKVKNESTFTAKDSTINANGFNIKTSTTESYAPLAIVGDDHKNTVNLNDKTIINGNIDLKTGDDQLTIGSSDMQMNGRQIDMGADNDTVTFGETVSTSGTPIRVNYDIFNTEKLVINALAELYPDIAIQGADTIDLNGKLVYQVNKVDDDSYQHALAKNGKDITINGTDGNELLIDVSDAEHTIDLGS
ncbi:beta strand repeat-containing protein, partial [Lonepinella sp. BR2357]|uniref:beta strand repeat-containing protein n=1 Tax=Lonepinella sp. BR2357 TaxID=3434549 RepID=UPI003F6E1955